MKKYMGKIHEVQTLLKRKGTQKEAVRNGEKQRY